MNKTKIDWADSTWNPVTGCLHGCGYCYARGITGRYGCQGYPMLLNGEYAVCNMHYRFMTVNAGEGHLFELDAPLYQRTNDGHIILSAYPFQFRPTFHRYRLDEYTKKERPRDIFVCSMADLFGEWVPDAWIQEVFEACEAAPQHRYLFLTKNKDRYLRLAEKGLLPKQHWYGYSATTEKDLWRFHHADECPARNLFVSIEPILARMEPCFSTHCPADWVIIGAETGNRKDKVIPKREWVERIALECKYSGRPLFMKESLRELMGPDFVQEKPWQDTSSGASRHLPHEGKALNG